MFFYKECKRTQRSFIKNVKERKECSVLLKRTQKNARTLRSFEKHGCSTLSLWHAHLYSWRLQHLSNKLCCWSWSFYAKCNIQIFSGWSKLCKSLLRVHSWRKSWKIITSFISYRLDNIRRDYIDPDQNKIVRIRIQQKSGNPIGSGALDVRFCSNLFT